MDYLSIEGEESFSENAGSESESNVIQFPTANKEEQAPDESEAVKDGQEVFKKLLGGSQAMYDLYRDTLAALQTKSLFNRTGGVSPETAAEMSDQIRNEVVDKFKNGDLGVVYAGLSLKEIDLLPKLQDLEGQVANLMETRNNMHLPLDQRRAAIAALDGKQVEKGAIRRELFNVDLALDKLKEIHPEQKFINPIETNNWSEILSGPPEAEQEQAA